MCVTVVFVGSFDGWTVVVNVFLVVVVVVGGLFHWWWRCHWMTMLATLVVSDRHPVPAVLTSLKHVMCCFCLEVCRV